MKPINSDNFDEYEYLELAFNNYDRRGKRRRAKYKSKPLHLESELIVGQLTDFNDNAGDFLPTYAASLDPLHRERKWIINSLGGFYHDNVISDVTRIVKGGKEANVYCCTATPATGLELIAAKLYRPRMLRHLRNDALYKEGRIILDAQGKELRGNREARAMRKKTRFGKHMGMMTWIMHEYAYQQELYDAGADVPRPLAHHGNTILMAYIGDHRMSAPPLSDVSLEPEEARPLFERILANIRLMLAHHLIHGDLSAFNILYWEGKCTIIDFPQMVDARKNRNALMLLERDIRYVCEYFARQGVDSDPADLTMALWEEYMAGD